MKKIIIIYIGILVFVNIFSSAITQYLYSVSPNVGFSFLKIIPDAQNQSLLGCGTAGYNSASSYLINPAIASFNNFNEIVSFSYKNSMNLLNYGFMNYSKKLNKGNISFGIAYLKSDTIQLRGEIPTSEPLGDYTFSSITFSLGYGLLVNRGVYWGMYIRSIDEIFYLFNRTSYTISTGFLFTFQNIPGLSLGLSFLNIGPQYRYDADSPDYIITPFTVNLGIRKSVNWNDTYKLLLYSDLSKINDSEYTLTSAIEFYYNSIFKITVSFRDNDNTNMFSTGMGFNIKNITIDYAFTPHTFDLGFDNMITVNYNF